MKKNLFIWQAGGFTTAVVLGTVLHFLYSWTGAYILTPICAVNESTWEHMKILFVPMLFFSVFQFWFFKDYYAGFWWIKLIGTTVAVLSIPILFYTVNGAFGKTPDWLNIIFFFLSAFFGYFIEYVLFKKDFQLKYPIIAFSILMAVFTIFAVFTLYTPKIPLFKDPLTNSYGLIKK